MGKTVEVKLGERSYPIFIGRGMSLASTLGEVRGAKALVVSDSNVDPIHGETCRRRLMEQGLATIPVVVPAVASVEIASLAHRPAAEVLPAVSWRSRLWPMIGSALVWATRELLPEVIAAWRASRTGVSQPISCKPDASVRRTSTARRNGHRYRWGRA